MPEIMIGALIFVGELVGGHIRVAVLGDGAAGHRPLCGNIIVSPAEWASLKQFDEVLAAADQRIAELAASAAAALSDVARLDELHTKELRRMDSALATARKERDVYTATFNLACKLQDADQCEDHSTGDDCDTGDVEHELFEHLSNVRINEGDRTDPVERGEKKRGPAVPSTESHVINDVEECVSWCIACRENRSRGLNPDGSAKAVPGG